MSVFDFIKQAVWYFILGCWIFTGLVGIPAILVLRFKGWHRRRKMFQRIKAKAWDRRRKILQRLKAVVK
jgi:hypothetical protein